MSVQLIDSAGRPLVGTDGFLLPHARTFSSVLNGVWKTYSHRFDEAMRDSKENAQAMRRDAYYIGLVQERVTPTTNLPHTIRVEDAADPEQVRVRDDIARCVARVPHWTWLAQNLMEAFWFGRAGVQLRWANAHDGWGVADHRPVHGDKIQFRWDGTPAVMLNASAGADAAVQDPGSVILTDAGAWAMLLDKPARRDRFVVHRHRVEDADFFAPEMGGGVGGVGLRHMVYWSGWMRTEAVTWMLAFLESVGMMDLMVFNYPTGNPAAQLRAEDNARAISGKVALAVPRGPTETYAAVETISASAAGVDTLRNLVEGYYERHIERVAVGQTLSSGTEGGGLGGSGVASLHRDTKFQLIKSDARNLAETLSTDLVGPMVRLRHPTATFRVWLELVLPDPEAKEKLAAGKTLVDMGVKVKLSELYAAAGYTEPGDGDATVGGQEDAPPADPADDGGVQPGPGDGGGGDVPPEEMAAWIEAAAEGLDVDEPDEPAAVVSALYQHDDDGAELYAVEWRSYTDPATGRPGWKSAGGLVRYTDPRTDEPAGPQTDPTPAGQPPARTAARPSRPSDEELATGPRKSIKPGVDRVTAGGRDYAVKARTGDALGPVAEAMASAFAAELGVSVPVSELRAVGGTPAVVTPWVAGTPLADIPKADRAAALAAVPKAEIDKQMLFDYLVHHTDVHEGNFIVGDGAFYGIDKEFSFGNMGGKRASVGTTFKPPRHLGDLTPHPDPDTYTLDPVVMKDLAEKALAAAATLPPAEAKVVRRRAEILAAVAAGGDTSVRRLKQVAAQGHPNPVVGAFRNLFGF